MTNFRTSKIITLLLAIYGVYIIWDLAVNVNESMWDSKTYYYSAKALDQNLNPYNITDLSTVSKLPWELPYVYPPLTLNFFRVISCENAESSSIAILLLKSILCFFLILIWKRILNIRRDNIFYLFILLSFNSAVYIDLRTGNIALIIQFFFWIAIYFYFRKKYLLFCIFLILASVFKITPIIFLLLLLLTKDKKKYLYFSGASIIFVLYLLLNYLTYPELFIEFIKAAAGSIGGRGISNPSLFSLLTDLSPYTYIQLVSIDLADKVKLITFVLLSLMIVFVTVRSIRKINSGNNFLFKDKEYITVFLICIVLSFILPRFKDYEYIFLILPAFFIINKSEFINPFYLLIFIFVIASAKVTLPGVKIIYRFLWTYYPLIQAIIVWVLYLRYLKRFSNVNGDIVSDVEIQLKPVRS